MTPERRTLATLTSLVALAGCVGNPAEPRIESTDALAAKQGARSTYVFTRLDVPGARQTIASGINAAGHIVGWYFAQDGTVHGFIYQNGVYTTVDYRSDDPGTVVTQTQLRGIGPGGEVVGSYRIAGEGPFDIHGFTRSRSGEFARADYPGHRSTIPQRILPDGTLLGCYHDEDTMGSMFGMTLKGTDTSSIDMGASMHNGATPDRRKVTGLFTDMETTPSRGRAYVIEDGTFTPFDAPNSTHTEAWDMNPAGSIVGLFRDKSGRTHGYVLEDGQFTTIDFPNSTYTDVFGINARGDIVGKFREAATGTAFHGYVATRVAIR